MSTSQKLNNAKSKILKTWEARVREAFSHSIDQSRLELLDHLPQFIDELIKAIDVRYQQQTINSAAHFSEIHGTDRALTEEYSMSHTLAEYAILRSVIIETLEEDWQIPSDERRTLNWYIDDAIVVAGSVFAEIRKAQALALMETVNEKNGHLLQFAAIAAHDIRSPLATILGYLEIVKDINKNGNDSKEAIQYIEKAQEISKQSLMMIDRLLQFSSMGVEKLKIENIDLNEIVLESQEMLGVEMQKSKPEITKGKLPIIKGDRVLIAQLFQNILSNAMKYRNPEKCIIQISASQLDDKKWKITVRDNGIGFDTKDSSKIFEPFIRLENSKDYKGSGLGLATCKKIVELHGGKIWAESLKNQGTEFIFTLSAAT